MSSLPAILKNEILEPLFKESGKQIDVLNKVVSMLSVNFSSQEERLESGGEWVSFVQNFKLTAPEIIEAYKLTLMRELRNERNEVIRLFPNLSLISAGEVLIAFQEYKRNSKQYENGLKELKLLVDPIKIETEEEKLQRLESSFKIFVEDLKNGKPKTSRRAFLFFDWLFDAGKLDQFLPDKEGLKKLRQDRMKKFIFKEFKKPIFFRIDELKKLKKLIDNNEKIPVHGIVRQQIRDEIVIKYVKNLKN